MTNFIAKETPTIGLRPFTTDDGQEISDFDKLPRDVNLKEVLRLPGHEVHPHRHIWGQLLYASQGVMQVRAQGHIWVIPPQRAVWIPPDVEHSIKLIHKVRLRNVYVAPNAMQGLPSRCQVMHISPLLREIIAQAVTFPPLYDTDGAEGRLIRVLLDCLKTAPSTPLHLPVPDHGIIKTIANILKEKPDDTKTLENWADELGTTSRTLARNFKKQTDMTFGQWRQQARLLDALSRLADNQPIAHIAQDLGYSSQSAFSAMFKKALGVTPGQYFKTD
jgi:AraC-like DNA-binding protein/mannose-6-phosphate isomerase-like protein (cupin superfamily)